MKKPNLLHQFNALPKLHKILSFAFIGCVLSICCLLPFVFLESDNTSTKVALVNTVSLPTATRIQLTATIAKTATVAIISTATDTPIPEIIATSTIAPTETPVPSPTQNSIVFNSCISPGATVEYATVVRIVDGDTIDVNMGGTVRTVRYIGVDTPELGNAYFQEASNRNSELVLGKEVVLVKDVSETDQYQRLLRYVFVDGFFINEVLVQDGFALAKEYPPDTSCHQVFTTAQSTASTKFTGIWVPSPTIAVMATQPPVAGSGGCPTGCLEPKPGCEIKGNISSKGEKIYHDLSSSSYSSTKIDTSKGERWFCTADEAIANGWRAPRN